MQEPSAVYRFPYPRMTSHAEDGQPACDAEMEFEASVFYCTREQAHEGRHEAGGLDQKMRASWPRPTAEVTFSDGAKE